MDEAVVVLPAGPWAAAALTLVLVVGLAVPPRAGSVAPVGSGRSLLTGRRAAPVALAVGLLLAAVARLGPASTLSNPVPALVVGVGWPLLFVLPLALRRPDPEGSRSVLPAVPVAVAAVWFLTLYGQRTDPRHLAAALLAYVVVMASIGIGFGRAAAARTEVLGLVASWVSVGHRLPRWTPPRGAAVVLAVVLAGAWCERLQRSTDAPSRAVLVAGCIVAAALVALVLQRRDATPALVPLVAAAVVAGGLRRALISAQLLAQRDVVVADPLGTVGGQAASLALVAVGGCLAAAVVARRAAPGGARLPALAVVSAATTVSALVVLRP